MPDFMQRQDLEFATPEEGVAGTPEEEEERQRLLERFWKERIKKKPWKKK